MDKLSRLETLYNMLKTHFGEAAECPDCAAHAKPIVQALSKVAPRSIRLGQDGYALQDLAFDAAAGALLEVAYRGIMSRSAEFETVVEEARPAMKEILDLLNLSKADREAAGCAQAPTRTVSARAAL